MSEVEKYQPQDPDELRRKAVEYAESGMFRDALKAEQALVKIYAGAELGLNPFQSMSGVHIIQGKAVIGGGLLAVALDKDPDYDYDVAWEGEPGAETACIITVTKNGKTRGASRFSLDDATRAGLVAKNANYKAYPPNMLFNRAMSNAVRWYAPGVTSIPVYVEGEDGVADEIQRDVPEDVTVKPRTRVTAEVIPQHEVEVEPERYSLTALLKAMSAHDRAELYDTVGIERGTKTSEVLLILRAELDKLDMPDTEEPDPAQILALHRRDRSKDGSAEAFQHMLDTDEDLDPGDQASLEALA